MALLAIGLIVVFALAWWLDPYDADGTARRIGTHQQLGMPPCTFLLLTKTPCPSCGLTTSMSLLVHGDIGNSLRANFVGTLSAVFGLVMIPWSLASAIKARLLGIRSCERAMTWFVAAFVILLMVRWIVVVVSHWGFGT